MNWLSVSWDLVLLVLVARSVGGAPEAAMRPWTGVEDEAYELVMRRAGLCGVLALAYVLATSCVDDRMPERRKEAVLRTDLRTFRDVLQQYRADRGVYPESLRDLVDDGYLRAIPVDPMTGSNATWVVVHRTTGGRREVINVRSGAMGKATDGSRYADW